MIYEKKGYLHDNFRVFHLKDKSDKEYNFHYHDFYKILIFISGNAEYSVEGRTYNLRPFDIILINAGEVHKPIVNGNETYERIIFYISPEFLQKQSAEECNLEQLFDGIHGHVLRLKEHRYQKVFDLAKLLEEELNKDSYGKNIMANSLLLQLLVRLGRYRERGQLMPAERPKVSDVRITRLLSFIENHLSEELSVEDLAESVFMSRYHMMRLFKKETGQSVYDYLTERRLFFARELIRQGVPATESCFQAGFGSYSSFTRAYGKRFGTTPTGRNGRYISMDETEE